MMQKMMMGFQRVLKGGNEFVQEIYKCVLHTFQMISHPCTQNPYTF
ncbi:unnamed protein product [Schistosoma margrebowiei]|uniref:Uncharacterized protein n=1 Tax=Schistosoma margrebowiei TaxID=48269 RepID=A0A183MAQ2_9TREM|nr:unnamed protein product [Schistosoma margrebowiei]